MDKSKYIQIKFQEGPVQENGVNGVQTEDVIDVLVDRLEGFQSGAFPCHENEIAINGLGVARRALNDRTRKREEQGVEGKYENHESLHDKSDYIVIDMNEMRDYIYRSLVEQGKEIDRELVEDMIAAQDDFYTSEGLLDPVDEDSVSQ